MTTVASMLRIASARAIELPQEPSDENVGRKIEEAVDNLFDTLDAGCHLLNHKNHELLSKATAEVEVLVRSIREIEPGVTPAFRSRANELFELEPALITLACARQLLADVFGRIQHMEHIPQAAAVEYLEHLWDQVYDKANSLIETVAVLRGASGGENFAVSGIRNEGAMRTTPRGSLNSFQKIATDSLKQEAQRMCIESHEAHSVMTLIKDIMAEIDYTDPDELWSMLVQAKKIDAGRACTFFPPWESMLEHGEQRIKEADEYIEKLREKAHGILHVPSLRNIIADSKAFGVRGERIEWIERVLNELEIADQATSKDAGAFWPMRRNLGRSWDHRPKLGVAPMFSRPVDNLTCRLAKGARLRDFISLTNTPLRESLAAAVSPAPNNIIGTSPVSDGGEGVFLDHPLSASFQESKKTPTLRVTTGTPF